MMHALFISSRVGASVMTPVQPVVISRRNRLAEADGLRRQASPRISVASCSKNARARLRSLS